VRSELAEKDRRLMAPGTLQPSSPSDGAGKIIGDYKLLAKLGSGGMGSVFQARNLKTNHVVAFKVLMPSNAKNERLLMRFQRESKIALCVKHPNLVAGLDAGIVGNLCFLAMEYVDGESLSDLLKREKRLDPRKVVRLMTEIAAGLSYAHEQGLIHRDIKPENILLGRDGSVKICDLGLAREVQDTGFTMLGAAIGTPKYMSPEQVAGVKTIDARTDIYSLGATAYHMLAGQTPYTAKSSAMMMAAQVSGTFTPLLSVAPDVDGKLAAIVERCMQKDPNARYRDMEELLDALVKVGGKRSTKAGKASRAAPPDRAERRGQSPSGKRGSGMFVLVIVLLALGAIAAGVWAAVWGPLKKQSSDFLRQLSLEYESTQRHTDC
jgi:serine/threonine protein kinase